MAFQIPGLLRRQIRSKSFPIHVTNAKALTPPWRRSANMSSHARTSSTDWNQCEQFFSFTRGRFVVQENDQMKRRYVKFNMHELVQVAARSINAQRCITVRKCPDGMYNKCFVLTMDDGREVIAKIPNPNAGVPHFTTASEVATMDFARSVLGTPVPKVFAWNSKAKNSVGVEYIIMEKMPGIQLSEVWKDMKPGDKMQLRLNLALYQEKWSSVMFRQIGGLYYRQDLEEEFCEEHLYTDSKGHRIHDSRFVVGPVNGRDWVDCGRGTLKCDRGPWLTSGDYRQAVGCRELAATESKPLPPQTVMVCGPQLYQPEASKKSSAIKSYLRVYDALLPDYPEAAAPSLWHDDLHEENLFVDPKDPTKVVGIIDWQSVDLLPLFDHNLDPAFIQCSGPNPETLERPELEDTSGMSNEERSRAISEFFEKSLFVASRKITQKKMPSVFYAIEYQQTEAFSLLTIARRLFEFGEAHFHGLTVELSDEWPNLPLIKKSTASRPFPLNFDDAHIAEVEEDWKKAMHGMQIMNEFKMRLGPLWPEKDAVSHELYHDAKAALKELKEEVIEEFARTENDRIEFDRLWPFDS